MPKTPGKMHMYDMVNIDRIVFEIVGGGGGGGLRIVLLQNNARELCTHSNWYYYARFIKCYANSV